MTVSLKGQKCVKCGSKEDLTRHHIKPKSRGGSDSSDNIMILCNKCHNELHNKRRVKKVKRKSIGGRWFFSVEFPKSGS